MDILVNNKEGMMRNIFGNVIEKIVFVLSISFFLGILIGACSLFPDSVKIEQPWIPTWLSNPICDIPCWENITPGKTNIQEVPSILKDIGGVLTDNSNKTDLTGSCLFYGFLDNFGNSTGVGNLCTGINTPDIVEEIHIYTNYSSPTIYLKDVIDTFGDPDYITIVTERNYCAPLVLYKTRGFAMSFSFGSCKEKYRISETMVVDSLYFYNPTSEPFSNERIRGPYYYNPQNLKEWSGFGLYSLDN